jgi:hypothetical protein
VAKNEHAGFFHYSYTEFEEFTMFDGFIVFIYRVSQEERTIFWEVIVSVILSKKLYMNMCPILNGLRDSHFSGLA